MGVPSNSFIAMSIFLWSVTFQPFRAEAITSLTFATAFSTPNPLYQRSSPSRSSWASWLPVDRPAGTSACPINRPSTHISACTVGQPLQSMICLALTSLIRKLPIEISYFSSINNRILFYPSAPLPSSTHFLLLFLAVFMSFLENPSNNSQRISNMISYTLLGQ